MTDFAALIDGYRRFHETDWQAERARWTELAAGQSPRVMVIGCSDSRVDPATIFDARPGEMFVVRNIAALVPPYAPTGGVHGVSAAIEFAVTKLGVDEIVVLGHGACGGVNAALTQSLKAAPRGEGGFVAEWIGLLDEARDRVADACGTGSAGQAALEREGVKVSVANLMTFPFIRERVEAGTLALRGAVFAIADGGLDVLGDDGAFASA